MQYVPVPVAMLETGRSLPVDMWSPDGRLLLRKGQSIVSEQQKRMLEAHEACMTPVDANAWQKSFERVIRAMLRDGIDIETIAHTCMPEEILESDYIVTAEVNGGWLDLQIILQGLLYQGEAAISPLSRLQGIQQKALELLKSNPDECLFILFQALADPSLGYCATHALLCAVVCELTAEKLGVSDMARNTLFNAALVMNIGMAREQDRMARQTSIINDAQRKLIKEHPQKSQCSGTTKRMKPTAWLAPSNAAAFCGSLTALWPRWPRAKRGWPCRPWEPSRPFFWSPPKARPRPEPPWPRHSGSIRRALTFNWSMAKKLCPSHAGVVPTTRMW
ncbi:MAG: hypothetical protein IPH54_16315 [Rhodoferax sp.]|nr:hypothetical protein [Rhodoferax sp.]